MLCVRQKISTSWLSPWLICTIIALPPPNVQRSIMDCSELTCRIIAQAIRNSCAHRIARSRRKRIRLARIRGKRLRCGDELRVRDTVDLGKGNLKLNIAKNDDMGPHAALAAFGSSRQWTSSCVQLFTVRRIYSRQNQDRVAHLLRCSLPGPILDQYMLRKDYYMLGKDYLHHCNQFGTGVHVPIPVGRGDIIRHTQKPGATMSSRRGLAPGGLYSLWDIMNRFFVARACQAFADVLGISIKMGRENIPFRRITGNTSLKKFSQIYPCIACRAI